VAVAGVWGGLTVKRSILLIQTLPAAGAVGLWWAA
jgi:putative membrane protein